MRTIHDMLHQLGVSRTYRGYALLVEALTMALEDEDCLLRIGREVYQPIALRHGTNVWCVERNLRTVIRLIWRTNPAHLQALAGYPLTQMPSVAQCMDILVTELLRKGEGRGRKSGPPAGDGEEGA